MEPLPSTKTSADGSRPESEEYGFRRFQVFILCYLFYLSFNPRGAALHELEMCWDLRCFWVVFGGLNRVRGGDGTRHTQNARRDNFRPSRESTGYLEIVFCPLAMIMLTNVAVVNMVSEKSARLVENMKIMSLKSCPPARRGLPPSGV